MTRLFTGSHHNNNNDNNERNDEVIAKHDNRDKRSTQLTQMFSPPLVYDFTAEAL